MKTIISVVGPTGIGKTRLAIDLARHFGTEIISCDSRQFFREMKIGTAAPTADELAEVPHHFIGNLSVKQYYSIGQYEIDVVQKTQELFQEHDVLLLVGGSMMYEKALLEGLHDLPEAHAGNQQKLQQLFEIEGLQKVQQLLHELDPEYFETVDRENPRRLFRAIDVIWQTNQKYSEIIAQPKAKRDFNFIRIGIEAPREMVYHHINTRVDRMLQGGLVPEVERLLPLLSLNLPSLNTVGYNEIFNYLSGVWTLDFAAEEIKKNSRRFAKRQLTWYRGENNIHWVNYRNSFAESLSLLSTLL